MKVTLAVLGLACFIGAAYALPIDEDFAVVPQVLPNFQEEDLVPEIFSEFESKLEEELSQTPSTRPPRPTPPPTTRPPRPPTTRPPRPTTQRTPRPPQIHDNNVDSQRPFSGRLVNVVANQKGVQRTLQRNRIEYNFNSIRRALDALLNDEETQ